MTCDGCSAAVQRSHSELLFSGLETFFQHVGLNHDSPGVSYRDLQEFFGADTPATHLLKPYDLNGDHRYSLAELRAAAALWGMPSKGRSGVGEGFKSCHLMPHVILLHFPPLFLWVLKLLTSGPWHSLITQTLLGCKPRGSHGQLLWLMC